MRALVAGAGGFIGGHLVQRLLNDGVDVTAIDKKFANEWYQVVPDDPHSFSLQGDLSDPVVCRELFGGSFGQFDEVYMLAADMGGMGFIENNKLDCMLTVLPSTNMLVAASQAKLPVGRFFYASSACVYAGYKQNEIFNPALKEEDAYPADAEDGYGWEKLFTERMCRHFTEDTGLVTRVARYHNVYGPHGTWDGGREKAPAAICRKVLEAKRSGVHSINIWGDGEQTRSFMYADDCVEGTLRIIRSDDWTEPLNLGSDRLVSINALVGIVENIAGIELERTHDLGAPQGVRGRNSDNTLLEETIGWVPQVGLEDGLQSTYTWIEGEMNGLS
jgi:GDP-D-mannose 3', 5'-epimerase